MARLKTEIRVTALIRRAQAGGAFAAVLRRGDSDAGALWVVVRQGMELFRYSEQMSMLGGREWYRDGPFDDQEKNINPAARGRKITTYSKTGFVSAASILK